MGWVRRRDQTETFLSVLGSFSFVEINFEIPVLILDLSSCSSSEISIWRSPCFAIPSLAGFLYRFLILYVPLGIPVRLQQESWI